MVQKLENKRIIFFGVLPESITNFRIDLISLLQSHDFSIEVIVASPSNEFCFQMKSRGIFVHEINLERRSYNIFNIIYSYIKYIKIIKISKPNLIISYTIKPIILSSFFRFFNSNFKLIIMFEGLGSVFDKKKGLQNILKKLLILFYKIIIPKVDSTIFLNNEDKKYFEKIKIITNINKSFLLNGIGINLNHFEYFPLIPNNKITFLFIGRLIKEKGVYDFINAAKIVKKFFPDVQFNIIGHIENDGIKLPDIIKLHEKGVVNYLGVLKDVRPAIKDCSAFILPTYYNEGLPRTILEALAIGRTIVTTNTKGCNQTVVEGENGYFVEIMNPLSLSNILICFINNPTQLETMGLKSRKLCENTFSEKNINKYFLNKIILPLIYD